MGSQKTRKGYDRAGAPPTGRPATRPAGRPVKASSSRRPARGVLAAIVVAIVAIVGIGAAVLLSGQGPAAAGTGAAGTTAMTGTVVQGSGGTWLDISPDTLAAEMKAKDFTLLNVKTPYIGEISGTDLYIPYTQLAARASELPADKTSRIVVYCRSGNESAIASQTLLDLGYTNIQNLDGGMNAWTASGRSLVQKNRG
jgi:phage shock protein E